MVSYSTKVWQEPKQSEAAVEAVVDAAVEAAVEVAAAALQAWAIISSECDFMSWLVTRRRDFR